MGAATERVIVDFKNAKGYPNAGRHRRAWSVKLVTCCAHTISGHIHLEVKDGPEQTLAATNAAWGDFIARQLHAVSFKALLAAPRSAAVDRIEIEFETQAQG